MTGPSNQPSKHGAVLLAAGRGSRLSEHTEHLPKAILPIGPISANNKTETCFLRRQIGLLTYFNVDPIVVVIGYMQERVRAQLQEWAPQVRISVNPTPEIETSGSLHSLQFAIREHRELIDGSRQSLYMDADIVYHRDVLGLLSWHDSHWGLQPRKRSSWSLSISLLSMKPTCLESGLVCLPPPAKAQSRNERCL